MFKLELDWDKAHDSTDKVDVVENYVVEKDKGGNVLRMHSLRSLMPDELKNVSGMPCPAPQPAGYAHSAPQPPAAVPVQQKQIIKVDAYQFEQLLATLKTQSTDKNVRESSKLTLMEVHERLLAIKA